MVCYSSLKYSSAAIYLTPIFKESLSSEKNLTPEQFSEILVDDLEIPAAFVPVISNIIRTQVQIRDSTDIIRNSKGWRSETPK